VTIALADRAALRAVYAVFALNGLCFATLASRYPDLRSALHLSNGSLGLLLLVIAFGSMVGMPASGHLIERYGADRVVRMAAWVVAGSMVVAGVGAATGAVALVALGLGGYGIGTGTWDVAVNVEGAGVERLLGQSIMSRFHAGWSVGTFSGAGVGAVAAALGVPLPVHFGAVAVAAASVVHVRSRAFASISEEPAETRKASRSAWLEPRTLAIGAMVLAFALAEGSANDWLALGLVDGYGAPHWVGVLGFATFVAAMTTGRFVGPPALDRFGRVRMLLASAVAGAVGILVVVWSGVAVLAVGGIVLWGLGAALGFPVGMSAAADDPLRAARRVSVVTTLGYGAFLGGPPLLGFVGNRVGTLDSLLVVALAMVPAALLVLAVRRPREAAR
jgi:MFS family permease